MKRLWTLLVVAFVAVALAIPATAGADTRDTVIIPNACNGEGYDDTDDTHKLVPTDLDASDFSYDAVTDVLTVFMKGGYTYFEDPNAYAGGDDELDPGWTGDATYIGNGADNVACGEEGEDRMFGKGGNDILSGGEDDDVLIGGVGNDILRGGDGDDLLRGGAGDDTLWGERGSDTAHGNPGEDIIYGYAPAGTQLLADNAADAKLTGGNDDDTIFASDFGQVAGGKVKGGTGDDTLNGGDAADWLVGNGNSDTIMGHDGPDLIEGLNGDDTLYGEAGKDRIRGDNGDDWIDGGAGSDDIRGGNGVDTIYGGDEDPGTGMADQSDDALAFGVPDFFTAPGFNDFIQGDGKADTLYAGDGALWWDDSQPSTGVLNINTQPLPGQAFAIAADIYTFVPFLTAPTAATGTVSFIGIATPGNQITVGSEVYQIVAGAPVLPNDISQGAHPQGMDLALNLAAAINASHPDVSAFVTGGPPWVVNIVADVAGVAGNAIPLAENSFPVPQIVTSGNFMAGGTGPVPGQVLLGATLAATQANVLAALSDGAGAATPDSVLGATYVAQLAPSLVVPGTWTGNALFLTSKARGLVANYPLAETMLGAGNFWGDLVPVGAMSGGADTGSGGPEFSVPNPLGDLIYGWDGDDDIFGADGNDRLEGDANDDTIMGGAGNDTLFGFAGADMLYGDAGNDILNADFVTDGAIDQLFGGTGNDTFNGGACDPLFPDAANESAGGGFDTVIEFLSISSFFEVVTVCP